MQTIQVNLEKHHPTQGQVLRYARQQGLKVTSVEEISVNTLSSYLPALTIRNAMRGVEVGDRARLQFPKDAEGISMICLKSGKDEVLVDHDSLADSLGVPEEERDEGLQWALNRFRKIPEGERFVHPLMEASKVNGIDTWNLWGVASVIVDAVMNPEATNDGGVKALNSFRLFVAQGNPTVAIQSLQENVQSRYLWACMEATNHIREALQAQVDKQMGEKS